MLPSRKLRNTSPGKGTELPLRRRVARQAVRGLVLAAVWALGAATTVVTGVTTEKVSKATTTTPAISYQVEEHHAYATPAYYFANDLPVDKLNDRISGWATQQDPTVESFDDRYAALLESVGGIQAPRWAKVTITNTQDRPITITTAHLVVLKREQRGYRAFHGIPAGGDSSVKLSFDLAKDRAPGLISLGAGTGDEVPPDFDAKQGKFSYFAANNKTIEPGSSFGFVTTLDTNQVTQASYLEWQLEFQILAKDRKGRDGTVELIVKDANGQLFRGAIGGGADSTAEYALNPDSGRIEPS